MDVDRIYNFRTISNTILNGEYRNLRVTANLGFKQAVRYSGPLHDVVSVRQRLILATGKNLMEADKVRYLLLEDDYENEILLAEDWIIKDTVELVKSLTVDFTITGLTSSDITVINNMLNALGHKPTNVNIK